MSKDIASRSNASSSEPEATSACRVTFTFEGLMVFHENTRHKRWEVGVITSVRNHRLKIKSKNQLPADLEQRMDNAEAATGLWAIDVLANDGRPVIGIDTRAEGHAGRRDSINGQHDFDWIMNVDEMHASKIKRKPGGFKPVIFLRRGVLGTFCKTDGLNLRLGVEGGKPFPFGFVAEIISLDIELQPEQTVVVRAVDQNGTPVGGSATEILRIPYAAGNSYQFDLKNVQDTDPGHAHGESHFQNYYETLIHDKQTGSPLQKNKRFEISMMEPPEPTSTVCPPKEESSQEASALFFGLSPYKCGPVATYASDESLS